MVADPLDAPGDDQHAQPVLAFLGGVAEAEHVVDGLAIRAVDEVVELVQRLGLLDVAVGECVQRDPDHLLGPDPHVLERAEDPIVAHVEAAHQLRELRHRDAVVGHPLEVKVHPEDGKDEAQVGRDRGLPGSGRCAARNFKWGLRSWARTCVRRWYEATGRPIHAASPQHDAVLVIRDITDRTVRRLQDEFLALASHELNTPLTTITGYMQLLAKELQALPEPAQATRWLQIAREEAKRLRRLVDDLLDVARLQSGKLTMVRTSIDLAQVVRQALAAAQTLAGDRPLRFTQDGGPVPMFGDAARLEQVMLEPAEQRAHLCPHVGDRRVSPAWEHVAELQVQDYGPGIPATLQPYLFTRFFQAVHAEHAGCGGLGLGLAIARDIVAAHEGQISAHSIVGTGTTFTIVLPLEEQGENGT